MAITAGLAAALAAPITAPGGSCLNQPGPTKTVSGLHTSRWHNMRLADDTRIDASTAQLVSSEAKILVFVGGGQRLCWHGGEIIGQQPPSTPYPTMHDTYGMNAHGPGFKLESIRIFDTGDGVTMDIPEDANWTLRDVYFKYLRDDCVENDFLNSGVIENSFFDGCYDGMSSREYRGVADGSNNLVVVRNSLWRLQAMDAAYGGPVPNHNAFWKWSGRGRPNNGVGPRLALYDNVFRADEPSWEGDRSGMYMAPPPGKLAACENNVMVWLGSGPFPEPLPATFDGHPCFRLLTGARGLQYWNDAVARWKASHPVVSQDVGAPIVSLWSPRWTTTLTGVVQLTATAVDDRDVAGVQFKLNDRNIGAEVITEAPITKFPLSWDSRDLPNGTYALTATARDAAGNTRTSAATTVTIRN